MRHIVKIDIFRMTESCDRTTYFVRLTTDEGMTMTPSSFASHCLYDDIAGRQGLSVTEARDRALTEAHEWGDFLEIEVTPYREDGITYEPSLPFETYTMRRESGEAS